MCSTPKSNICAELVLKSVIGPGRLSLVSEKKTDLGGVESQRPIQHIYSDTPSGVHGSPVITSSTIAATLHLLISYKNAET